MLLSGQGPRRTTQALLFLTQCTAALRLKELIHNTLYSLASPSPVSTEKEVAPL